MDASAEVGATTGPWRLARLMVSVALIWILFDRLALATNSQLGEAGLLVGVVVVAAVLLAQWLLFGPPLAAAPGRVGLGRPRAAGWLAAGVVSLLMLACFPAFAWATGTRLALRPGWLLLLPGLFAQAGVAEEVLFRGYLFGRLREGRTFWQAALLGMLPFLAVHLVLFARMDLAVAAAAVITSLVITFPLARLYELGGNTIWGAALVHWVVQGAIKVVLVGEASQLQLSLVWMGLCLLVPWVVFAFSPRTAARPAAASVVLPARAGT